MVGNKLDENTITAVQQFHENDKNSRMCLEKNNFVLVQINGFKKTFNSIQFQRTTHSFLKYFYWSEN